MTLLTAGDIVAQGLEVTTYFKDTRPQRYYATATKADIIDKLKEKYKNVPLESTVPNHPIHPLSKQLDEEKATNFLETMQGLHWRPLYIHKFQIELSIEKDCYELIKGPQGKGNAGRFLEENVDNTHVNYVYYRTGKVSISVQCSNNPFRIENENDLVVLYSFLGPSRDRLECHVSDLRRRLTPSITKWVLKQCDFNKDVPISDKAQISLPDIQLSSAFETFRTYVKNLGGKSFHRYEDSRQVNQPLTAYLSSTINPFAAIHAKLEKVGSLIEKSIDSPVNSSGY